PCRAARPGAAPRPRMVGPRPAWRAGGPSGAATVSAAAGVWLAVLLLRGLSSSRNAGSPPPPRRRDEVDGWLASVLIVEALAVVLGCTAFGGGWPLFFVAAVVLPFGPPWLLWRV